ncbi:MAG: hypothetical protein JWO86_1493 [Myxococcaceae bacterium]|nr:hypothetical protein [Myxococcaceae bacterium]
MTQPGFPAYGSPYGPGPGNLRDRGSVPPYSMGGSIPPNPYRPQRSPLPFILGGAGAFLFLLAAGGGAAAFFATRSKSVALPVDAKMLPSQTSGVSTQLIEATRETDKNVRRAYVAAELGAEVCRPGQQNPARRIEGIGGGSTRAAKDLFFKKGAIDEIRALLECGAVLEGSLESPYQAVITVDNEKKGGLQHIAVGHFSITDLPRKSGFTPFSYRGVDGFCRTQGDDRNGLFGAVPTSPPGTCDETSFGGFAQGTTWFLGNRAALETMAGSVKNPKEDLNVRLAALKDASAATQGLPVVRIQAQPKSSREFFVGPCLFGASHSAVPFTQFMEGCFPATGQERALEAIDAKIKAAAYETDGDLAKAKAFQGNIVFVARDDDSAIQVEREVKDVVADWRIHVEENDDKLIVQSNEFAVTAGQKKFAAVADDYFTALKGAKVTRKGRTVRVALRQALSKADLAALDEAESSTVEKRRATADILDAIQAKRPVPQPALAKLVGGPWATFLTGPAPLEAPPSIRAPMSTDECRKLQARVAGFSSSNFFSTDARLMFFSHKFANCVAHPPEVDSTQRACLAAFKTADEYGRCAAADLGATIPLGQPPESIFGERHR